MRTIVGMMVLEKRLFYCVKNITERWLYNEYRKSSIKRRVAYSKLRGAFLMRCLFKKKSKDCGAYSRAALNRGFTVILKGIKRRPYKVENRIPYTSSKLASNVCYTSRLYFWTCFHILMLYVIFLSRLQEFHNRHIQMYISSFQEIILDVTKVPTFLMYPYYF